MSIWPHGLLLLFAQEGLFFAWLRDTLKNTLVLDILLVKSRDFFGPEHLVVLDEAVKASEELVTDYFDLSSRNWLRHPYEVCTLREASESEHPGNALAHLVRYAKKFEEKSRGADSQVLYKIFLNDQKILNHVLVRQGVSIYAVLVYVISHELVHIVRFSTFCVHPELGEKEREERKVHSLTNDILINTPIKGIMSVLDYFKPEA